MKLAALALSNNVKYHDHLHPKVWDRGDVLKPEIRAKLIEIAEKFVAFLEIDESAVEDYHLVGSIANYNWSKYSDIDLHILMDYKKVGAACGDDELVEDFLMTKRSLWLEKYDLEINGIPMEVGPQDTAGILNSAAVYSILDNEWVKKPVHSKPDVDEEEYDTKLASMIKRIKAVLSKDAHSDELHAMRDEVKKMRQDSLGAGTEFSVNNLVFKTLRNQGFIEKIESLRDDKIEKELSL